MLTQTKTISASDRVRQLIRENENGPSITLTMMHEGYKLFEVIQVLEDAGFKVGAKVADGGHYRIKVSTTRHNRVTWSGLQIITEPNMNEVLWPLPEPGIIWWCDDCHTAKFRPIPGAWSLSEMMIQLNHHHHTVSPTCCCPSEDLNILHGSIEVFAPSWVGEQLDI